MYLVRIVVRIVSSVLIIVVVVETIQFHSTPHVLEETMHISDFGLADCTIAPLSGVAQITMPSMADQIVEVAFDPSLCEPPEFEPGQRSRIKFGHA